MKKTLTISLLLLFLLNSQKSNSQDYECTSGNPSPTINKENNLLEYSYKVIDSTKSVERVKISNEESVKITIASCHSYAVSYEISFPHKEGASSKELLLKALETLKKLVSVNDSPFKLADEIKDLEKYIKSSNFSPTEYYKKFFTDDYDYYQKQIEKIEIGKNTDKITIGMWIRV